MGGEVGGSGEDGVIMGDNDFEVSMEHSRGHVQRHWINGSGTQRKG